MAATRAWPTQSNHPSAITGPALAALQAAEGDALWNGVISQVGSVAGTVDIITGVCTPALTADPADGQTFRLTPAGNNTSATVTINIDSRGAITLNDVDGNALVADDLVAGRPITFYRHGSAGDYRLTGPTQRALLAALAAAIAGASAWEEIGDTTVSGSTAYVEHTFTAGDYAKIVTVFADVTTDAGADGIVGTLRHAGGAIVTIGTSSTVYDTSNRLGGEIEYLIGGRTSATKYHAAQMIVASTSAVDTTTPFVPTPTGGGSATAPDRVRYAHANGNIMLGRFVTYGLKV